MFSSPFGERLIPLRAVGMIGEPRDERRDTGGSGAIQSGDVVTVGTHRRHDGAVRRIGTGIEQRRQIGAGARDEDDEPRGQTNSSAVTDFARGEGMATIPAAWRDSGN